MSRTTLPKSTPDTRSRDLIRNLFARLLGDAPSRDARENASADASHNGAPHDSEDLFGDDPFGHDPFEAEVSSADPLLHNADFGGDGYSSFTSGAAEETLLSPSGTPSAEHHNAASIFGDDLFLIGDGGAGDGGSPTDDWYSGPVSDGGDMLLDPFGTSPAESLDSASIFGDGLGGDGLSGGEGLASGDGLSGHGFDSLSQDALSMGDGLASKGDFQTDGSDSFHLSVVEESDSPAETSALFGTPEADAETAAAEWLPAAPPAPAAGCLLSHLPARPPTDTHRVVAVRRDDLGQLNDTLELGWRVIQMLGCAQSGDFVVALRYAGHSA